MPDSASVPDAPLRTPPKFLVIQYGARHGYAVPAAFERADALAGLYTDLSSRDGMAPLIELASRLPGGRRARNILTRRTLPKELQRVTKSFGANFLAGQFAKRLIRGQAPRQRWDSAAQRLLEFEMKLAGSRGATHVYTMLGEGGQFVVQAKSQGLTIVGDVYIALSADSIVSEEERQFPDWCEGTDINAEKEDPRTKNQVLLTQSDLLVCPSDFVLDDLVANHGVQREKCLVAPYAVDQRWLRLNPDPMPRRVLFAGSANVRKGIHYLAMAATRLAPSGYKFVVAGGASAVVRTNPNAAALEFRGHLPTAELGEELRQADVFAFPTLAEGAASVVAEAMGAGLPVVTTRAAGSVVRDGVEGFIVPERDPEALAEAIRTISEDRALRARMSEAARKRAATFTWDQFVGSILSAAT